MSKIRDDDCFECRCEVIGDEAAWAEYEAGREFVCCAAHWDAELADCIENQIDGVLERRGE